MMHCMFIAYYLCVLLYTQNCNNNKMAFMHLSFIFTELKKTSSTDLSFRKCKSCYLLSSSLQGSGQNESSNQSLCSVGSLSDKELEVSAHLKLKQLLSHKHLCFCLEWVMQTDVFHVVSQGGPARCSNVVFGVMFYFTQ